jgi:hypothetical protein
MSPYVGYKNHPLTFTLKNTHGIEGKMYVVLTIEKYDETTGSQDNHAAL